MLYGVRLDLNLKIQNWHANVANVYEIQPLKG